jgi:hypothetical protein
VSQKKRWFRKPVWVLYAANPIEWLQLLKEEGCRSIRLVHKADNSNELNAPDHKLAPFVGGGGFNYLEAVFDHHSDFWMSRQEVTDPDAENRKIWSVTYGCIYPKQPIAYDPKSLTIAESSQNLKNVLERITDFANVHSPYWATTFQRALDFLNSDIPYKNENDKLIVPAHLIPIDSLRLLAAAGTAWVFGGMGSWNDLSFKDEMVEKQYDALSEELYASLHDCYACVANSFLIDSK